MGSVKILILLPFLWPLFESAKQQPDRSLASAATHSRIR
jgi:hypothetical protein